jgi:hypothetical protein
MLVAGNATVHFMKMVDPTSLSQMAGASLVTAHHKNAEICVNALVAELESDAFVHSKVTTTTRPNKERVSLAVNTRKGPKHVQASKVLITIPPPLWRT